jgi:hypothetical protein
MMNALTETGIAKAAVVILADTETHGDLARAVNALETVNKFMEAGDEVVLIFDGAGTRWGGRAEQAGPSLARALPSGRGPDRGSLCHCPAAFGVRESVQQAGVPLREEYDRHPSLRRLVRSGYEMVTF